MRRLFFAALMLTCATTAARGEAVNSLRLILPPQPAPVVENIGRVFARQVQSRCDAKVVTQGEAPLVVELSVEPGIGTEGYTIADGGNGTVHIRGNDTRGLLFGVGKFLHTSSYGSQGFTPGSWRGTSVPQMPVRGIYLATHFHNYYQVAPLEEVTRYMEDLSLWGVNSFLVWFGMEEFDGIDDPQAQAMLERLRALLKIVKDLGLNASLGCVANDGYKNTSPALRATMVPCNLGVELCPSKPGVPELEVSYCEEKCAAFKSVGLDYWFIAPYDNGGCACSQCAPWGVNGYLRMAELESRVYRRAFPSGKVVLSTWYFDRFADGEWAGVADNFGKQKPDWVDYIMADDFGDYPRYPLDQGVPGGLPLLNFPEISMWGHTPWGGYGANPQPGRLQKRWDGTGDKLSGGFPYSEGIYEDLNKVICAQLYWAPDRPAMETVQEYIAFEFSPEVVDDVASVVTILESNHLREQIGESAITACQLMDRADANLATQARRSWRWRMLSIRASIDQELYRNQFGQGRNQVFRQAYEELIKISHAENAHPMMRPVPIPAVNVDGPQLPAGYAESIAASKPIAWWRMNTLPDRSIEDASGKKNAAIRENGVVALVRPSGSATERAGDKSDNRAANFFGGRLKATIKELADTYSVEFWFYNTMSNTARPVTAYIFSRGLEGPEGTSGDNLGISGTSAIGTVPPGHLFFYNGNAAAQVVGQTELAPETWNHVVLVRDGKHVAVYLNGNGVPEISSAMEIGYPAGVAQLFVGGRNDNFANFQGKIAEASVYDRALTQDEAIRHDQAAGPRKSTVP
ncbi:MAG: LamG domain-containing protein [Pirellulaceae bacterium]